MTSDWTKWQAVLSPLARRLLTEIEERGEDEAVQMGELEATVGRRKTPIRNALAELERHGLISITEEEQ